MQIQLGGVLKAVPRPFAPSSLNLLTWLGTVLTSDILTQSVRPTFSVLPQQLVTPSPVSCTIWSLPAYRKPLNSLTIARLPSPLRATTNAVMADWSQDIAAYLEDDTRSFMPIFTIFPDWTPQVYEEVCTRIQAAFGEVGISLHGSLPRFSVSKNGRVLSSTGSRKRAAAETLLFGRYNHDGLLLLPHQKDPTVLPPSWFEHSMLVPGRYSIGQKLLSVTYSRIKEQLRKTQPDQIEDDAQPTVRTAHARARVVSTTETQNSLSTQEITRTRSAHTEQGISTAEQLSSFNTVAHVESQPAGSNARSASFEHLTIHIGTIFEMENGCLIMRRTLRNPESWAQSSASNSFDFEKVCQSVGVTSGWEKELYFFPDLSKDPHNILDENELDGAVHCLYNQGVKEGVEGNISLFVAADVSHVRELPLDQRSKCIIDPCLGLANGISTVLPKQTAQTVTVRQGRQ